MDAGPVGSGGGGAACRGSIPPSRVAGREEDDVDVKMEVEKMGVEDDVGVFCMVKVGGGRKGRGVSKLKHKKG